MFVYAKDRPVEDLGGGVTRKVVAHDGGLMQVEVNFEAGPSDRCTHTRTSSSPTCFWGEFEFTIGGETKIVRAGDTMYKKSGVPHGCRCLKQGVLLDTFTPQRDDYLPK